MTKKQKTLSEQLLLAVKNLEGTYKKVTDNQLRKANRFFKKGGTEIGLEIEVKQVRSKHK